MGFEPKAFRMRSGCATCPRSQIRAQAMSKYTNCDVRAAAFKQECGTARLACILSLTARLVLGWGTAWEHLRVLSAFPLHQSIPYPPSPNQTPHACKNYDYLTKCKKKMHNICRTLPWMHGTHIYLHQCVAVGRPARDHTYPFADSQTVSNAPIER